MDNEDLESAFGAAERDRQAAALDHLLCEIGLTPAGETRWWNLVGHSELDGRTATQAWLDGDTEAVRLLVARWYEATRSAADRIAANPELVSELRERLAHLDRIVDDGRLHRSA